MNKQILGALFLLAVAAPVVSQQEAEPYFSLSASQTFASHAEPQISLSATNVASLDFRVYRVNDTVKFFEQMEDPRNFGRATRPRAGSLTWIERIRRWKRQLRTNIRAGLRAQFTKPPHEHLPISPSAPPVTRDTRYAEAPVLNSQQLVLTFSQPITTKDRWSNQSVKLDLTEKGVYLVEASRGDLHAYTIVMVTDLVLTSKIGRGRVLNYVSNRATGEPVANAELYLLSPGNARIAAKTSSDGIADVALDGRKPEDLRVMARNGADVAANALDVYDFTSAGDRWASYIYTDRPVYRPGHTVHFKGIFRVREPSGYSLPKEVELPVKVEDSQGNVLLQKSLTLSRNGTANGEFVLPATASLGYYSIEFRTGEHFFTGSFEVEEYKKPEYEVRVTPDVRVLSQGTAIGAVVDAKYYFGEPVAGASVKYSVYREPYWFPLWYDPEDEDTPTEFDGEGYGGDEVSQGEGRLDDDGKLRIRVPTTVAESRRDFRYRIEARVTDEARREISGNGSAIATYGNFMLNVAPDSYVAAPGGKVGVKIEARDYENRPVTSPVRVELVRWDWRDPKKREVVATAESSVAANGEGRAEVTIPNAGGSYRVVVSARTKVGRTVEDTAYLWVSGAGDNFIDPRRQVEIIPDKKTYKRGDTAHLLVATGISGAPVLVTVEGRSLREHRVLRSNAPSVVFDVPITADDEPGLFVSAQFTREGTMYRGSKYVRVPADEHKLNVAVTPDKPQYLPGETATYSLAVTDLNGRPVPQAEFSLGVVDEAIYAIRPDTSPDMMREFFGRDYNHVSTSDSLTYYFYGEAGKRRMQLAQLRPPTKLAQLKPERLALPKVRKLFPDTAFWAAEVVTDAQGKAQAKVEFPDSLTTWRATARGVTADTKVGSAVAKNITRKNLILRFSVPRFFTRGDEVVISEIVHNYLETEQSTKLSLDVTGLEVMNGEPKTITIAPRSEARVDWRVRASSVGVAKLLGKALGPKESDALEVEIPVNAPGVKLSVSKGGSMAAGSSASAELTFPANIESGSRRIAIRVSPSISGALFGAVEYLTTFPYGCVEQTMSSFLPNIIVQQTVRDLGLKANLDQARLTEKITDGLDRLYSYQHRDGGWGWWETDETHPFMTAYVVAGLAQAQISGTGTRVDVVDRGRAWIEQALVKDKTLAPDLRAYMVYALALRKQAWSRTNDTVPVEVVYRDRAKLSPYGLALLGLALELDKDARTEQIATMLDGAAKQDAEQAWWPAERDELLDFSTDATPEATAFVARFLSHVRPASPLLPKAAAWLMNHRNEGYWWSSTKQTAMVIYGLADYLKVTKELNPDFTATVNLNGREVLSRHFDSATGANDAELVIPEANLQQAQNRLQFATTGTGRLYYSARAEYYSSEPRQERRGTISLNLLREYFRLVPTRTGDRIVYDTVPLDGPVASGDTLAVRLTVTGSDWSYLLIEDPIPSGTEFIARDDRYELRNRPPWWGYYFTRREMHDDRMAIFERDFSAGQRDYFYLLKVVNPGNFAVSPARVLPMYQPSVMATSSSRKVEVQQ